MIGGAQLQGRRRAVRARAARATDHRRRLSMAGQQLSPVRGHLARYVPHRLL